MLEVLLTGGKSGRFFPDSGPGSKILIAGTKDYGYFGEVTEAELGLNSEFTRLLDQTDATARSIDVVTNTWFKFVLKGKFLFFPKIPLAGVMPLKNLYAMRAVIDADDPLKYPTDITTSQPVYQQNLHIGNPTNELFKVRTFDQYPDVAQSPNTTGNVTPVAESEIAKLMMALMLSSPYPDVLKIKQYNWNNFTRIGGTDYHVFFTQDLGPNSNPLQSVFTLTTMYTNWVANTDSSAWRPLLQYIPEVDRAGLLLSADNLNVSNEGMPVQVVTAGVATADLLALTHFTNVVETQQVAPIGSSDVTVYAIAPLGGVATIDNDAPALSASSDINQHLYDIDGVTQSQYGGYFTAA
jgi:hypothetical protein